MILARIFGTGFRPEHVAPHIVDAVAREALDPT